MRVSGYEGRRGGERIVMDGGGMLIGVKDGKWYKLRVEEGVSGCVVEGC